MVKGFFYKWLSYGEFGFLDQSLGLIFGSVFLCILNGFGMCGCECSVNYELCLRDVSMWLLHDKCLINYLNELRNCICVSLWL